MNTSIPKPRTFLTAMTLLAASAPALGQMVYDNSSTSTFNSFGTGSPDIQTFGDYVTLAGGPTTITEVSFLLAAEQDNGNPEGNFGLFLYEDNGGVVGNLLGSATLNNYVFPGNGGHWLTFSGLGIPVGGSVFVALSIENYNGDGTFNDFIGVEMYDPPTIGSSDSDTMLFAFGSGLTTGDAPTAVLGAGLNNIAMTITAVPEPGEYALAAGFGLAAFALWRRRAAR